jgi:hypothetical protein
MAVSHFVGLSLTPPQEGFIHARDISTRIFCRYISECKKWLRRFYPKKRLISGKINDGGVVFELVDGRESSTRKRTESSSSTPTASLLTKRIGRRFFASLGSLRFFGGKTSNTSAPAAARSSGKTPKPVRRSRRNEYNG